MSLESHFQEYFAALDRSDNKDRCWICCRTPQEVKHFFGFEEDGTPLDADAYGIEDIDIGAQETMSYRGERPICMVCQLNVDTIFALDQGAVLRRLLIQMREQRDQLWPDP